MDAEKAAPQATESPPADSATPPSAAQQPAPQVTPAHFSARVERLKVSAKFAAICSAPVLFAGIWILLLCVNRQSDQTLLGHVISSFFGSLQAALVCAVVIWFGLRQMILMVEKNLDHLQQNGQLVPARINDTPQVFGGFIMARVIGGALGALWEPLAPLLAEKIPILQVGYSYEIDGKQRHSSELFYASEAVTVTEADTAWALVDPKAPLVRHWLVRHYGPLQNSPIAELRR